ncbi:MAG: efflux RND transporter periplasmic adaptor subunit [Pirellulaceae bacterium]
MEKAMGHLAGFRESGAFRWAPVLLILAVASGCGGTTTGAPERPVTPVTVVSPLVQKVVEWDEYTGRLEAIDSVDVQARVSGHLDSIHFTDGQIVEKGDLLAIIDPRPFQAELRSAQARLEEAKARLLQAQSSVAESKAELRRANARAAVTEKRQERARQLLSNNAISTEDAEMRGSEANQAIAAVDVAAAQAEAADAAIATSKAAIETAQAEIQTAELNLAYAEVRAPISGRISREYITEGNWINGGSSQATLITTIVSIDPIHCYFDTDEQAFLKYSRLAQAGELASAREAKHPVHLALMDEADYPHRGHMDFLDNRLDHNTATMRGRAIFSNKDQMLIPGMFAKVRLPGSGQYEAVMVPDSAIGSDQSVRFVYAVGEDQKVVRKDITMGPIVNGLRVIREGLDGNELIVTQGLQMIFPGAEVAPSQQTLEPQGDNDSLADHQPIPESEWISKRRKSEISPSEKQDLGAAPFTPEGVARRIMRAKGKQE